MHRDRLFASTVDWLAEVGSRNPPDEHELLLASGRLRLLLLDSRRLVDQVNAKRRLDIRYRIVRLERGPYMQALLQLPEPMLMWAALDGIAPDLARPGSGPVESVGLREFLRERVMIYQGEDVTVRDLIDHVANVAGGVHAGQARSQRDVKLNEMAEAMILGGVRAPIMCLRGIVVVVVEALQPLRSAVGTP